MTFQRKKVAGPDSRFSENLETQSVNNSMRVDYVEKSVFPRGNLSGRTAVAHNARRGERQRCCAAAPDSINIARQSITRSIAIKSNGFSNLLPELTGFVQVSMIHKYNTYCRVCI